MTTDAPRWQRITALVLLCGGLATFLVGIGVSVAVNDDDAPDDELCASAAQAQAGVAGLLATSSDEAATAGDVREAVDVVLLDLVQLDRAAAGRYGDDLAVLGDRVLDLRRGVSEVDQDALAVTVRPLVDETVDDAQATYQHLADAIAPTCTERKG